MNFASMLKRSTDAQSGSPKICSLISAGVDWNAILTMSRTRMFCAISRPPGCMDSAPPRFSALTLIDATSREAAFATHAGSLGACARTLRVKDAMLTAMIAVRGRLNQSSVGFSMWSTTTTSNGAVVDCNLRPSCSSKAVKNDGSVLPVPVADACGSENSMAKLYKPCSPVRSTTGRPA